MNEEDHKWMRHALKLAERGWGTTHPNPMVGCVIVRDGKWIAEGWHEVCGGPHAENMAIAQVAPAELQGATLYVTLEPCSTPGKTGSCTHRILETGIRRVVMATHDPNPDHAGAAIRLLRQAGVEVESGCCETQARQMNWIFNHHIVHREPLVAGKVATTLDGKIATRKGHSQWITSAEARADVMRWRQYFPAIAVGAGTVRADNPALTIRVPGEQERSPLRLVLDRSGVLKEEWSHYRLFTDTFQEQTIWVIPQSVAEAVGNIHREFAGQIWAVPEDTVKQDVLLWEFVLQKAWESGICGVWVEGGRVVFSSLLAARKLHALWHYRAPLFLADNAAPGWIEGAAPQTLQEGFHLIEVNTQEIGTNQLIRGLVLYPHGEDPVYSPEPSASREKKER